MEFCLACVSLSRLIFLPPFHLNLHCCPCHLHAAHIPHRIHVGTVIPNPNSRVYRLWFTCRHTSIHERLSVIAPETEAPSDPLFRMTTHSFHSTRKNKPPTSLEINQTSSQPPSQLQRAITVAYRLNRSGSSWGRSTHVYFFDMT